MSIEIELLDFKKKVEEAKEKKAQSQGKIEHMEAELKTLLKSESLANVDDQISKMKTDIDDMKTLLTEGVKELNSIPELQ